MLDAGERRRRRRRRLGHPWLARDSARDGGGGATAGHWALPVERDAAHRASGHRPERVADEEHHRPEQPDGAGKRQHPE